MKKILPLCLALAACVHADVTYLPDGRQGYVIQCNGKWNSSADCMKKAGEMCGANGYDVITGEKEATFNASSAWGQWGGASGINASQNRSVMIACKGSGR